MEAVQKLCVICGKWFKPGGTKHSKTRYCCSRECAGKRLSEKAKAGLLKPWKELPVTVVNCNKSLYEVMGVYRIKNNINGKVYVGSSVNLSKRLGIHYSQLAKGVHANVDLLHDWIVFGESAFEWSILEFVSERNQLLSREQVWMDETKCYESEYGYNEHHLAGSSRGYKFRPELHKRISDAHKGFKPSAKLSTDDVIEICKLLNQGHTTGQIAKMYNCSPTTIGYIKRGDTWREITSQYLNLDINTQTTLMTPGLINEIKNLVDNGNESYASIARRYNINGNKVREIGLGIVWTDGANIYRNSNA